MGLINNDNALIDFSVFILDEKNIKCVPIFVHAGLENTLIKQESSYSNIQLSMGGNCMLHHVKSPKENVVQDAKTKLNPSNVQPLGQKSDRS